MIPPPALPGAHMPSFAANSGAGQLNMILPSRPCYYGHNLVFKSLLFLLVLARYIPRYQDTLRLSVNRKSTSSVFVEDSVPSSRRGKPSYCTAQATGWYTNSHPSDSWDLGPQRPQTRQGRGRARLCVHTRGSSRWGTYV